MTDPIEKGMAVQFKNRTNPHLIFTAVKNTNGMVDLMMIDNGANVNTLTLPEDFLIEVRFLQAPGQRGRNYHGHGQWVRVDEMAKFLNPPKKKVIVVDEDEL